MKTPYKVGDKSKGICPICNKIVETIFKNKIDNLISYCIICNEPVGYPHQNTINQV
jgi:hypothetical protein